MGPRFNHYRVKIVAFALICTFLIVELSSVSSVRAEETQGDIQTVVVTFEFDRSAVQALLVPGEARLTITGKWHAVLFKGSDTIRVIDPGEGQGQGHGNRPEVPPGQSGEHPGQGPSETLLGQGGQPTGQGNDQSQGNQSSNQGNVQGNQNQGESGNQGSGQGQGNSGQGNGQNQSNNGNSSQGKAKGKNK